MLIEPLRLAALSAAADREVVFRPTKNDFAYAHALVGTLLKADGKTAYILTDIGVAICTKNGAIVVWCGKEYPARLLKSDEDLGLAWFSIPCQTSMPPLPIAAGHTIGVWWDHQADLEASFKENMELVNMDLDGPKTKGWGGGVFTLDESNLQVMLAGVDAGNLLGTLKESPCPAILVQCLLPIGRRPGHGSCSRSR